MVKSSIGVANVTVAMPLWTAANWVRPLTWKVTMPWVTRLPDRSVTRAVTVSTCVKPG